MMAERLSSVSEASQKPIRVMIVDDAVVVRGLLSRWLQEADGIEVIATCRNGNEAVSALREPDLIILDIDMPEMDGMTALPLLVKKWPDASIIMASTLTVRNADYTLRSLSMGADDYIAKPATNRDVTFSLDFRREIVAKVMALGRKPKRSAKLESKIAKVSMVEETVITANKSVVVSDSAAPPVSRQRTDVGSGSGFLLRPMPNVPPKLLMIGASTGGPRAILELLQACRSIVQAVPVIIVQHMPPIFTQSFAENISKQLAMDASEAQHGEMLEGGRIYVAPGGRHLRINRHQGGNCIALDDSAPVNFFRPSVDVSFMSAGIVYGPNVVAVMLTGMGSDGLLGATGLVEKGGTLLAQDEASSIVWGMPGCVARKGLCSAVAPISELAAILTSLTVRCVR
jgi:two-component system, chemotaxis family, protein-glutamate methylesterase/glutaminase